MVPEERRAHERIETSLPVRVEVASGRSFDGTIENIGEYGVFVSTLDLETAFDVAETLTLRFTREDGTEVTAKGSVVRVDQEFTAGDIRRAFAVKFDEPL
ncbi:MAG: PilZ domain-containing protein [Planctomycetota bacterium]